MSLPIASPDDLAALLGVSVDNDRAWFLLKKAQSKCEAYVSPLPPAADTVVLDVAMRAYTNPRNVFNPTSTGFTEQVTSTISGGLWLTRANKADLRRLAGASNAFSIDPTPADAGPRNVWVQVPETIDEFVNQPPFYGDWDNPA